MNSLRFSAALLFTVFLSSLSFAGEKSPPEALGLECTKLEKETLCYEKALASKLDSFRDYYETYLKAEAKEIERAQTFRENSEAIIADVNRMVGARVDEAWKKSQENLVNMFVRPKLYLGQVRERLNLYLVLRATVKEYLRKGGALPGFTYDEASDTASYYFGREFSSEKPPDEGPLSLFFLVASPETFEKDVEGQFSALAELRIVLPAIVFHELAEMTILQWLRFYDPYFRWFSDGFANAIASRLLRKYVGEDAAKDFAAAYDLQKYSDLEKETNLYYWMGLAFCIKTPLESEERLSLARYAFATYEAERLIEEHGIECLPRILEKACKGRTNDSRNLVEAIREVTGEDIEKRFRRYQTFQTKEEGIKKYAPRFNDAVQKKDYQKALVNLLRVQELRGPGIQDYSNAAYLLLRLGHEEAGDQAIRDHLELLEDRELQWPHFVLQKLFVEYALKCRNLKKAYDTAEEILRVSPDFAPALAVRMDKLGSSGDVSGAKEIARRILELEKDADSLPSRFARAVLAMPEKK